MANIESCVYNDYMLYAIANFIHQITTKTQQFNTCTVYALASPIDIIKEESVDFKQFVTNEVITFPRKKGTTIPQMYINNNNHKLSNNLFRFMY